MDTASESNTNADNTGVKNDWTAQVLFFCVLSSNYTAFRVLALPRIQKEAQEALGNLLEKFSFSARSFHRIMRVARTLADLAGDEEVGRSHVLKAVSFRRTL